MIIGIVIGFIIGYFFRFLKKSEIKEIKLRKIEKKYILSSKQGYLKYCFLTSDEECPKNNIEMQVSKHIYEKYEIGDIIEI